MKIRRIFYNGGIGDSMDDEVPDGDPKALPKVAIYKGKPYEFFMYEQDIWPIEYKLTYCYISEEKYTHYDHTEVEVLSLADAPSECDCGGKKVGGTHSHWCSTQNAEIF